MATAQEQPRSISIPVTSMDDLETLAENRHHVLFGLTDELQARVQELIQRTGYDQGELFNLAITCFQMCLDAVEEGHRVGVVDDDREMSLEFTGFHKNDPIDE